jgi:hypothetical protein
MGTLGKWMVLLAILLAIIVAIGPERGGRSDSTAAVGPVDPAYRARRLVRAALREPDSASFGRTFPGRGGAYCGYVNARGSGGYTGMREFVVADQIGVAVNDGSNRFANAWHAHCARR